MDVTRSVELLTMQMKMEMNSLRSDWAPGDYLKFAKQGFEILKQCGPYDTTVRARCFRIITTYVQRLNDYNVNFLAKNRRPTHSSIMLHSFFLCDLQQYDPKWMDEMVTNYPHAFMYLGQSWCAWTSIYR